MIPIRIFYRSFWLALAVFLVAIVQCVASKLSGTVVDAEGKPAAGIRVGLFPSFSYAEKKTDSEGHFTLTFDPNRMGPFGETQPMVVARDTDRNLAVAVELEEDATNAEVRLELGLTVAGRVADSEGNVLSNAQVSTILHTERVGLSFGAPVRTDAEGRFEIKALPQGRRYSVAVSARGFGRGERDLADTDTTTNRIELKTIKLARANQRIAGVVLDADDQPVPRAYIYTSGDKQPNLNLQANTNGQFSANKVCPGPIELSANTAKGEYGYVRAEGGDTNITVRVSSRRSMPMAAASAPRLKGKPLPELGTLGFTPAELPADRPVLAVLIDFEQRPSRRALRLLGDQAAALKEKGVAVVVLQAGGMSDDAFKTWKRDAASPFPAGRLPGTGEKARTTWGAKALPWLILTDKAHHVAAEGFEIEELEAKLNETSK